MNFFVNCLLAEVSLTHPGCCDDSLGSGRVRMCSPLKLGEVLIIDFSLPLIAKMEVRGDGVMHRPQAWENTGYI